MIEKSWLALLETRGMGIGSGNYYSAIYSYGLEDFRKLRDVLLPSFYGAHTKIVKIATELGIAGLLLFTLFVIECLVALRKRGDEWSVRLFVMLVFFLVSSSLYESSYSYKYHNSNIQMLLFMGLGSLRQWSRPIFRGWALGIALTAAGVWLLFYTGLSYYMYCSSLYRPSFEDMSHEERIDHFVSKNIIAEQFMLYVPKLNFRTAMYMRSKNSELAMVLFDKETRSHSYDIHRLYEAVLYFQDEGHFAKALSIMDRMEQVHKNYFPLAYLRLRQSLMQSPPIVDAKAIEAFEAEMKALRKLIGQKIKQAPAMASRFEKRLTKLDELENQIREDGFLRSSETGG